MHFIIGARFNVLGYHREPGTSARHPLRLEVNARIEAPGGTAPEEFRADVQAWFNKTWPLCDFGEADCARIAHRAALWLSTTRAPDAWVSVEITEDERLSVAVVIDPHVRDRGLRL